MSTRGERLSEYLRVKTGGRRGWQTALVEKSGVKRQTISKWTKPTFDAYPDLETLGLVAQALGVKTYEIVAALDGEAPVVPLDPATREAVTEVLVELLPGLLEDLGVRLPQRTPRGRAGAA